MKYIINVTVSLSSYLVYLFGSFEAKWEMGDEFIKRSGNQNGKTYRLTDTPGGKCTWGINKCLYLLDAILM